MPRYSEKFKANSLYLLNELKENREVKIKNSIITNVRDLCKALDISSYSLYDWEEKGITPKKFEKIEKPEKSIKKEKSKVTPKKKKTIEKKETNIDSDVNLLKEISNEELSKEGELKINSQIRYYSLLASIHGIKNYSSLSLNQLKLKLGIQFLKESKLIDSKLKIILNGDSNNGK